MATITPTVYRVIPNLELTIVGYLTAATADSGDSFSVANEFSTVTGAFAFDFTTGDSVTATVSTTTITIDAAGGTTDHTYLVFVVGSLLKK
jgi:hypothetical protein